MGKIHRPKKGSRGFIRTRARRRIPNLRYDRAVSPRNQSSGLSEIIAIKAGMTHVSETRVVPVSPKSKVTRNVPFCLPVTVLEIPKLTIKGIRVYEQEYDGSHRVVKEIRENFQQGVDAYQTAHHLRLLVEIGIKDIKALPSKKDRVIELGLVGSIQDQIKFIKESDVELDTSSFSPVGSFLDVTGITKGHGFTGVVKRMGVKLLSHKNSKQRRAIGNLGPKRPGRVRSTVPRSGQYGSTQRTAYNSRLLMVSDDPTKVNQDGGFLQYGDVHRTFFLLEGSVPSGRKGFVFVRRSIRPQRNTKIFRSENIEYISTTSKQ